MDANSGRLKADMYSHNFNLLGKSYDNYTNKFPHTTSPTPLSHHPMFCLSIFPSPFPLLLSLASLLVLESKKQPQITAYSMTLLHSLVMEEEKHEGTIMGSVQVLSEAQLEF